MNKHIQILFFYLFSTTLIAQSISSSVVSSGGNMVTNGVISLEFTIGELAVTDITNGTKTLTQGFQQGNIKVFIKVNPIVFLEGAAYNSTIASDGLMRDDLRVGVGSGSLIPFTSPYTDNLVAESTVFNITGTNAIVDWVWVELRDKNDFTQVVQGTSALLQRDGDIVANDGVSSLEFEQVSDDYYVLVNHRNHLAILSANPIALSKNTTTVDYSSNVSVIRGGTNAVKEISTGIYALIGGDFDENAQVQNSDVNPIILLLGTQGYNNADVDMNGQIQNTDVNNIVTPNIGKGEQF